jgi:bifunctional non-homologous end joining protein LigD
LLYYAFDLLFLNGKDMRSLPLKERRASLEKLLLGSAVKFSASLQGARDDVIKAVTEQGMEGTVAKKIDSVYELGDRSGAWVKLPLKTKR